MKKIISIITSALYITTLISMPSYADNDINAYENVYPQFLEVQKYIEQGLYIEAMQLCENVQNEHNLSNDDKCLFNDLYSSAYSSYQEYLIEKDKLSYYNAINELNQAKYYINSGMYLEALHICETMLNLYSLSEEDIENFKSLYNTAHICYNSYLNNMNTITLGYGAPYQYGCNYHITPEQAIYAIKQIYGIDTTHTLTGTTIFWFEGNGQSFEVKRWYNTSTVNIHDIFL